MTYKTSSCTMLHMETSYCTTKGHETKPQHGKSGLCQACYRKKRRDEARGDTPKQKPGPKPDPTKPYSRYNPDSHHRTAETSTQCSSGHKWQDGSYKVRSDGKKICLVCIEVRKGDYCPAGLHLRSEHQNKYGHCSACYRENARKNMLSSKYKLTEDEFEAKLEAQEYKCAICFDDLDFDKHGGVCIDHDHSCCPGETTCGKCVRDILCGTCNKALGGFKDSRTVLLSALRYLDRHN